LYDEVGDGGVVELEECDVGASIMNRMTLFKAME
jgi:hypothetical protein